MVHYQEGEDQDFEWKCIYNPIPTQEADVMWVVDNSIHTIRSALWLIQQESHVVVPHMLRVQVLQLTQWGVVGHKQRHTLNLQKDREEKWKLHTFAHNSKVKLFLKLFLTMLVIKQLTAAFDISSTVNLPQRKSMALVN